MKIAFVPSTFLPIFSGAEIQSHNLANKLTEKNTKVIIKSYKKLNTLLIILIDKIINNFIY